MVITATPPLARAQSTAEPTVRSDSQAQAVHVRVALSPAADELLMSARLRRLLAVELGPSASIEAEPVGPLGADLIRVWVALPSRRRAAIEVRGTGRPLARRTLAIGGFPGDVAARVVAIEVSEMVRVQQSALRRPPASRNPPSARDGHGGLGDHNPFAVSAGGVVQWLPTGTPDWAAGPELALEHRRRFTSQSLYGRWLEGAGEGQLLRWREVGAAIEARLTPAPDSWRLRFGASAAAVALDLPRAKLVGAAAGTTAWSARAGGVVGLEAAVARDAWLGVAIEPGAVLRSVAYQTADGSRQTIGGFSLGLGVRLVADPDPHRGGSRTQPSEPSQTRR